MDLYPFFKKFLFALPPETAHALAFKLLKFSSFCLPTPLDSQKIQRQPLEILDLKFPHPIGLAAGLDKNGEYLNLLKKLGFSFIEVGTVTPRPQEGNKKPRLFRLEKDQALINRMGFNNLGIDYLINNIKNSEFNGILGINIGKNASTPMELAHEDYLIGLEKAYLHASYITINISSPNTKNLRDLQSQHYFSDFLSVLKNKQSELEKKYPLKKTPLLIKLSPDLTEAEIEWMSETIVKKQMQGLILSNTTLQRPETLKSNKILTEQTGGLSGHPLYPFALKTIKLFRIYLDQQTESKKLPRVPIIGVGGIDSKEKITSMQAAGADLVQLYSGLIYQGPGLIKKLLEKQFKN